MAFLTAKLLYPAHKPEIWLVEVVQNIQGCREAF